MKLRKLGLNDDLRVKDTFDYLAYRCRTEHPANTLARLDLAFSLCGAASMAVSGTATFPYYHNARESVNEIAKVLRRNQWATFPYFPFELLCAEHSDIEYFLMQVVSPSALAAAERAICEELIPAR